MGRQGLLEERAGGRNSENNSLEQGCPISVGQDRAGKRLEAGIQR